MPRRSVALVLILATLVALCRHQASAKTADPSQEPHFLTFTVHSPRQAGPTLVRVLLPEAFHKRCALRVVYVLPVEAGDGEQYGRGLEEIRRLRLHERHHVACVAPNFFDLPWYADHPTDPRVAQESYFLNDVLPRVESQFPVRMDRAGRLLLGFSKSGWGAFSLLLRHPKVFERAVAWDAPLAMDAPGLYGSGPIFGTPENFNQYEIHRLLGQAAFLQAAPPRLFLSGWWNFPRDHQRIHARMLELGIPHENSQRKSAPHDWHSGWVEPSMAWLCRP